MKRATQTRARSRGLVVLAATLTVLSGCEEVLQSQGASEGADAADSDKIELLPQVSSNSQRDVEAPDVFSVTEAGLWDGRPSLGGIWVAHPDVNQPERVLIKNTANNKTVTGALFRRERDLPGPALQVSSAAAEELEMLAGAPTRVSVVALRREEVEEKPPAEEPAPEAEAVSEETEVAAAEATPEAVEEEQTAKRKWWQRKEPAVAAVGAAAATAATESEDAAEVAVDTASAAASSAAAPGLSDAPVAAPPEKPAKRKWWQKKQPDEITETPLDPIEGAAAAIDAAEPTPAAAAAASSTATGVPLSKPFVQVGTFSVEANANTAADKVRRNGMSAEVRELKTEDKTVWRVLVGPASTRAERRAIQSDVKDLGFTDAFTVSN